MTQTAIMIVTLLNGIMVSLLTVFGPSTNRFGTWPAWVRALIVTGLTTGAAITKAELDTGALWDPSMVLIVTTGVTGIIKVLLEASGNETPAAKDARIARKYGTWVSMLCLPMLLAGCAGRFEEAKAAGKAFRASPDGATVDCVSIDNAHITWSAVQKGAAALAGAEGISIIPVEDKNGRIALAAAVAGTATIAIIAGVVADGEAEKWARYCSEKAVPR
jgi:hypothetical protein